MNKHNCLTAESVNNTKEMVYKKLQRLRVQYERGLILDYIQEVNNLFDEFFWGLLDENRLSLRISSSNWDVFLADYGLWSEDSTPDSNEKESWPVDVFHGEATVSDKIQFFRLMEIFHLPPEFFTPIPTDIINPDIHYIHAYSDNTHYAIHFDCIDDGGLLSDRASIGKTFMLANKLGLKAVVTIMGVLPKCGIWRGITSRQEGGNRVKITEVCPKTDCNCTDCDDYAPTKEYIAEGYIEGYTAIERKYPEIAICTDRHGKVTHLGIFMMNDDAIAFHRYPLWKEYFAWNSEQNKRAQDIMTKFWDSFKINAET